MKRTAALLVLLCGCPEDTQPGMVPLPPESVARLVSMEGKVTLERGGAPARPAVPGALLENDVLNTAEASKALVRAPGGREIELGPSTRFKVGRTMGDVEVSEGTISFLAGDDDGGTTSVTTKFGRTNVTPGTRATLALNAGGLSVDVSVGTITQVDEDGGVRSAASGQKMEIAVGAIEVMAPEPTPEPPKELALELTDESGRVMLKKKGETKFTPAKKVQIVGGGTAFQVTPGARARLAAQGFSLRLPSGNGVVTQVSTGPAGNAVELDVGGPVQLGLDGKTPSAVTFGGKNPLTVKGKTESTAFVNKGRIEVLMGELELETNGKTQVVKAGEVASISAKGVDVASRPRPLLVLPMGKKVRVYAKRLGEVGLSLPDEGGRAQVANDAAFTDVTLSGAAKDFVAVAAPAAGELHWRTLDENGEAKATGQVRFLADTGGAHDETSHGDVVAETGLKATVYFQSAVPTLTFTFPQAEGAKGYRFKVYRASDLKTPLVEKKANENKLTVEPGVLTEGGYVWYASPLDDAGNEKGGGRMNKMDIIYDNSLTTLSITSPHDGDRAEGAKAQGTAPLGSKLFINGKAAALDSSGRFSLPLGKAETVVFRVVSADGSESYWLRHLKH